MPHMSHDGLSHSDLILPNLRQGAWPPPGDELKRGGVDVLVLCAKENQNAALYTGIEVILAPGDDDCRPWRLPNFISIWQTAARQVADHVIAGRLVLVTCIMGQNRSGMVTALALRELTGWSGQQIVDHIQKQRPMALSNHAFVDWLVKNLT